VFDIQDDIFSDFVDVNNNLRQLLLLLSKRVPDVCFNLILNQGESISLQENPLLSPDVCQQVVEKAHALNNLAYLELPDGQFFFALPIGELEAVLIMGPFAKAPDATMRNYVTAIIRLCVELYLSQKTLKDEKAYLIIQKEQHNRRIKVFEKKYQEILQDNHRNFQTIEKQQLEYSQKLKSEIDRQTAELRATNERLQKTSRLQEKILDNAATAIFTVDPDRRITNVNEEFCSLTEFKKKDVIGKRCSILRPDFCSKVCPMFDSAGETRIFKKQDTIYTRNGRERKIIRNAEIIHQEGDSSAFTGAVESFVDVTDLVDAREAAETANIAKSEFLANMSHEIRTPMNAVIGFTDMLLETNLDNKQRDYAGTIKSGGRSLLHLINDILDFSKIEARELSLEVIDFCPEQIAFEVCELVRPKIGSKPVEVLCRIDNEVPINIIGDPVRFRQILTNLVDNAAKFTESGEIEIGLFVNEVKHKRIKILVIIRDTGIGIPQDKLATIFEAFQQADGSTTRKYGGSGLGLSICKQLANLMGGDIWAESRDGKGSEFHFTAWFNIEETEKATQLPPAKFSGRKALLVDENHKNLEILEHILNSVGLRVTVLQNKTDMYHVLQKASAAQDPFDLCIVDVKANKENDFNVSRQIIELKEQHPDLFMVAQSYSIAALDIDKCRKFGFDRFLKKPVRRDRVIQILEELIENKEDRCSTEPSVDKHADKSSIAQKGKGQSVKILIAEDNPVNQKLIKMILSKAGYQVEIANNGKEAVEKVSASPEKYNVVFMDVQMPELDGLKATEIIRKNGFDTIPIVAMTAHAMTGDREKCLNAGMDDYMTKPIKKEKVFEIIENLSKKEDL
jgi:two-component system sensor histidine kinase/response regulator